MKKQILTVCLLACSAAGFAQERCVGDGDYVGNAPTGTAPNSYEAGGGRTGPDKNADGDAINSGNIAIGQMASGTGTNTVAIGQQAGAHGTDAIAVGTLANASADSAIAIGTGASATRCTNIAIGDSASATGRSATATGSFSNASGDGSTADGYNARATAQGATANGAYSNASASNATANGYNAQATHTNSVALGANSRTTRANEVNIGNRVLGGVNDGVMPTDGVNVRQMKAGDAWTLAQANMYSDLGDQWVLNQANYYTDEKVKGLAKRIDRMGAMNTAMAMMTSSAASIPSKSKVAVGVGYTNGEPAVAVGYQRNWLTKKNRPMSFIVGASFARKERSVGAGMAWGLK